MRSHPSFAWIAQIHLSLVIALVASGCLDVRQHFMINPDGSGKVAIAAVLRAPAFHTFGDEDLLRERIANMLTKTTGVEAWKDVSYRAFEGEIHFSGTAYFKDVNELHVPELALRSISWTRMDNGRYALETSIEGGEIEMALDVYDMYSTVEPIDARIDSFQAHYAARAPEWRAQAEAFNLRRWFMLPGTPRDIAGFMPWRVGPLKFELDGDAMRHAIDSLLADRTAVRRAITEVNYDPLRQIMLPQGNPRAVVTPEGTYFDYPKEVAAARPGYERLLKELRKK